MNLLPLSSHSIRCCADVISQVHRLFPGYADLFRMVSTIVSSVSGCFMVKLQVSNFNGLVLALETLSCSAKQACKLFEKGFDFRPGGFLVGR